MSRRRMMLMAQQNKGFELIYDSSSGIVPDNTVWRRFANPWNDKFGNGTQKITDNVLVLHNGHAYEKQGYYPIGHEYADNCELSVTFISTDDQIVIHLTDGMLSAMGTVGDQTFRVRPGDGTGITYQQAIEFKDINTFKIIKEGKIANYYFNDELLFTQTELFSIDSITTGTAGPTSSSNVGLITERINGWGYGAVELILIYLVLLTRRYNE